MNKYTDQSANAHPEQHTLLVDEKKNSSDRAFREVSSRGAAGLVCEADQKRTVEYAGYKVGLFYISPFDLFVEGEAVIGKLEKKKSKSVRE